MCSDEGKALPDTEELCGTVRPPETGKFWHQCASGRVSDEPSYGHTRSKLPKSGFGALNVGPLSTAKTWPQSGCHEGKVNVKGIKGCKTI